MKSIELTVDTSLRDTARIVLAIDGVDHEYSQMIDTRKAQVVLPLIEQALKKHKVTFTDISKLYAPVGPGSFTGLRVGASIVNILGTALRIPINGKPLGILLEPVYE